METKRLITAMAVGLGLILLYFAGLRWLDTYMKWGPPQTSTTAPAQTQPATAPATQPAVATTESTTQPSATQPTLEAARGGAEVVPASPANPKAIALGSVKANDPSFALQLDAQPTGAAMAKVVLNSFKAAAGSKELYTFQTPVDVGGSEMAALASRSITVVDAGNKATYDLSGVHWTLSNAQTNPAVYSADLVDHGHKLLTISKSFEVFPRTSPSQGYEVHVVYTFANDTDRPFTIQTTFNGPTLPPAETNRPPDRQVVAGFLVDKDSLNVEDHPIEEFKADKNNGDIDLTKDKKGHPARWAGAASNYFGAIILPENMVVGGKATDKADYIASIVAHGVNLDEELVDNHQAFLTFETTDLKIEPGKPVALPLSVYLGPKWRDVLDTPHYASFPRAYSLMLIIRGGFCGFCTFAWLVNAIVWLLSKLQFVLRDWGLAIIGLVAIVRLLLHPITRQSQISMAKMSKMGPEMKRLQEKYKDDKESLNKAMVDFHKQQGLGPYLGCLPMFLQMPIWIALYAVLETTFELRQAPFLWNLTWIHDLAQPDFLVHFAHPVRVLFFDIRGLNLVPVLLSAAMFFQQQFMPKPVAATPEQMKQQRMMQWLSPIMFLFFFYNLPSGLNLYIFTSTAVGVIESKIIRDHLKAREEAEKAGRVFVGTKPTRGSKQGKMLVTPQEPPKRGLLGKLFAPLTNWWTKMLERAEQVRQEQDRRGKKKV